MRILITGGAGFIGSHLVHQLLTENHEIIVIDNLTSGNLANIHDISDHITFHPTFDKLTLIPKVEIIYHLGLPSSSPMYKQDPLLIAQALRDWITLLDYAKKHECKIVYASSSSLYNGQVPPFHEELTILVTDYYTEARYAMERLAQLYHQLHDVKAIGLRLFSVYGPNETYKQQYANCLTQFLWDLLNHRAPIVFGDGSQTRDLIYVSDVVHAFRLAADSPLNTGVFNVGTGVSYSFTTIIDLLNHALGISITPQTIENPISNYVMHTCADTQKAKTCLGFQHQVTLNEGIRNIIQYYRS